MVTRTVEGLTLKGEVTHHPSESSAYTSSDAVTANYFLICRMTAFPYTFNYMTHKNLHTPAFIAEMKEKLVAEKKALEGELPTLDRPEYGRTDEENAAEVADFESSKATTNALKERLESIRSALERIEQETYGTTEDGEIIPEDRLRANPAATTLVVKK